MLKLDNLDELLSFKPIIQDLRKTKKEFLKITLKEGKSLPWESKVGAFPYLEKKEAYPKNSKGEYLRLLAQINFAEAPKLENFPESGILQFFIFGDDLYGANFDDQSKQENFRIIYYKDICKDESKLVQDFSFLPALEEDHYLPLNKESKMSFEKSEELVTFSSFEMKTYLDKLDENSRNFWKDMDKYQENFSGFEHKIGGYPAFTQNDPRFYQAYKDFDILLFQLDSDEKHGISWGDMGIANFFIKSKALKKLDFSEVLYNWDCY